jgi:ABC-type multidrug transport system fused ATPase/permease subunit
MSRREIAERLGYVSQTPFLFCGTIEDNIAYGCGTVTHVQVEEATELSIAAASESTKRRGFPNRMEPVE